MKNFIGRAGKAFLKNFNIDLIRSHNKDKENLITNKIGAVGAAEAFSHYVLNYEELSKDAELKEFMAFYADKWKPSASQWSQDIFALYASQCKTKGSFLEVGGADGFTHSNTLMLERSYEWSGTLIEPDTEQFNILKNVRPNCINVKAAISVCDKDDYATLRKIGQLSALAGHEGDDMHLKTRLSSTHFEKVRTLSLSAILGETQFDYFSLDIEGAELATLESLSWTTINKPRSISVEHNFREEDKKNILEILTSQGYQEIFTDYDWLTRGDIWAILRE